MGPALSYRRTGGYVPPFYPERGDGTVACALKLVVAVTLLVPPAILMVVVTSRMNRWRLSPVEHVSGLVALALAGLLLSLPSILMARRSLKPFWKRWKTTHLRGEPQGTATRWFEFVRSFTRIG